VVKSMLPPTPRAPHLAPEYAANATKVAALRPSGASAPHTQEVVGHVEDVTRRCATHADLRPGGSQMSMSCRVVADCAQEDVTVVVRPQNDARACVQIPTAAFGGE
jgi:hypothetical protein